MGRNHKIYSLKPKTCKISKKDYTNLREFELYGVGEMPKKLRRTQDKLVKCILKKLKEEGEI